MLIGGLQKTTLIDYPGKISCTVFVIGCSFRCPWCYNPELVLPEEIKNVPQISEKEFFEFLRERKNFLEGVCIGGGEPTIHPELIEFCKKIKKMGYSVKLDTNGSNPGIIKELIDRRLVDYVALDVKAPIEKYPKVVGMENQMGFRGGRLNFWAQAIIKNIQTSINLLKEGKIDSEFRTTVTPVFLKKEDIFKIVRWIGPAKKYFLQNFQPKRTIDPKFEKVKPYSREYLLEIRKAIAPFFDICQIR